VAAKDGVGRAKTGKVPGKMDEIENSPQKTFSPDVCPAIKLKGKRSICIK